MAGLVTGIRDVMNPHARIAIRDPEKQKVTAEAIKHMLKRKGVVSWGWEVSDKRIVFRVYEPHQYTTKGLLKEKEVELE